jgi:hypothetical protein
MDSSVLLAALALPFSVLIFALWRLRSLKPARTRRALRKRQRSDIRTALGGPVKVAGSLLLGDKSLRAPLSGRTCALYDVVVFVHGEVDKVLIQERRACDFLVDDGTGTALVRAGAVDQGSPGSKLELAIVQDGRYESGIFNDATPELERFLSIYGEKSKGLLLNRKLSYREGVFVAGEHVVVYGQARREPDPDAAADGGSYRERPTRLVIEPLAGTIHLSDDPDMVGGPAPPENES